MNKNNFSEQDKQKVIEYLNSVAKYASFNLNTEELIQYYKLLSYMQTVILPKINDNILEIKNVVENENLPEVNKE